MSKRKKILIAGYYGFGNIGDEAILSAILADLRERREELEFIVVSGNPTYTASNHNVQSVDRKDIDALLNAAKESDLVILGGGGLFQDYWGAPKAYSAIGTLAVLYQKPFMLYSVGVGPVFSEEGKQLIHWTFDLANVCTVRDLESRDLLISLGIPKEKVVITSDPVLTLSLDSTSAAEILRSHGIDRQTRPLLGVCIRNWGEETSADQWKREVATALDQFIVTHDVQVLFIPFQIEDHRLENDHSVALDIVSTMKNQDRVCVLSELYTPALTGGLISHCHLILGMRLHSLIFAANMGIPAVALAYDPKVDHFMKSLGLSEYAIDLPSLTTEQLFNILDTAWAQQKQIRQALRVRVQKLKRLAKKTPDIALKLLDKKLKTPFSMEIVQALAIQQTRALAESEQELQILRLQLEAEKQEVLKLKSQISDIANSRYWKLAQMFRKIRVSLVPVGSRRERVGQVLYRFSREIFHMLARDATLIRESIRQYGLLTASLRGLRILTVRAYHLTRGSRNLEKDLALVKSSSLFDEAWYLANNPDVSESKVDPLFHYVSKGGFEGRDPSPHFSSLWYLNRYKDVKKASINPLVHYLKFGRIEDRVISSVQQAQTSQVLEPYQNESRSTFSGMVRDLINNLNARSLKGIFVVTSAFAFDEFFNQRVINLSKFLSQQNWGILYIAWRWSEKEAMPPLDKEVYKNIFQVPVDVFLKNIDAFPEIQYSQKYFLIEFPYPGFFLSGLKLGRNGFKIVYEIIDEWEEFHKVDQAIWFNKSLEDAFVINADFVTAVSRPLIEKFSVLRQDIHLSPNGYTPALLGEAHQNISRNKQIQKEEMHLGYFGHLTESWFDWNFLLEVLANARKKKFKLYVHLIGYGAPELQKKLGPYSDRVKFYGKIHPSELYKYVKEWDAAMIWFRSGKLSEAVDPIKIYEYLYFGLPTIVKGISHLKDFPLTYVVTNATQALDTLIALHNNGLEHLRVSQEITDTANQMLVKSTWEQRFTDLIEFLNSKKQLFL